MHQQDLTLMKTLCRAASIPHQQKTAYAQHIDSSAFLQARNKSLCYALKQSSSNNYGQLSHHLNINIKYHNQDMIQG
ncbi:unnamed protein product [Paramecium octaurelia]|uniref:Uncharacterized protein n=1 Tax=Paramecium octaurelia TaxID=43137 RepID=A0A8S1W5Y4_PAROT|nr:unnamed protein product [Paramecium octaurelia]